MLVPVTSSILALHEPSNSIGQHRNNLHLAGSNTLFLKRNTLCCHVIPLLGIGLGSRVNVVGLVVKHLIEMPLVGSPSVRPRRRASDRGYQPASARIIASPKTARPDGREEVEAKQKRIMKRSTCKVALDSSFAFMRISPPMRIWGERVRGKFAC